MDSQAVKTQVKIYLSFFDAAGYQSRLEQLCTGSPTMPVCHFLANEDIDGPLFVIGHTDGLHSHACLSVYASTATLSVYESTAEGTWILPPGWSPGVSNIFDRVPVRSSSEAQETVIQLRPGDQILSKGGRWSVDFLVQQMTPNLVSLPEQDDTYAVSGHVQVPKHSHYSQLDYMADTLHPAPTLGCLHHLLELNEPNRAITWAKAAYHREDNHAILQVSLCHHYRSTFESYGLLISPSILLKAVKSAFPSVSIYKEPSNVPDYVIKGIRLREETSESLPVVEQDPAAAAAFPRLRDIQLDAESVSPDILEGMETPIDKVMEDSQAMSSLNACGSVALGEDHESLELSMTEQDVPALYRPSDPDQLLQQLLGSLLDETLASESPKTYNTLESMSTTICSVVGEGSPDHRTAASTVASSPKPTVMPQEIQRLGAVSIPAVASPPKPTFTIGENDSPSIVQVSATVSQPIPSSSKVQTMELAETQGGSKIKSVALQAANDQSSLVDDRLCDRDNPKEVDVTIEHCSTNTVYWHRKKTVRFITPPCASDAYEDLGNASPSSEEEVADKPTKAQHKGKRQPLRQDPGPAKRQKSGVESSVASVILEVDGHAEACSELDGDTIVVESGDIANHVFAATEHASPDLQKSVTSVLLTEQIDPTPISVQHRKPSPRARSQPRNTESNVVGQISSDAPSIFFSSSTEIGSKKNIMAFLRQSGGKSVKNITSATMLCVGSNGPLRKTANLILAICMGLDIVTEKWLVESQRRGVLLDPQRYLPKDPHREEEWDFKLDEAIARGKTQGTLTSLLAGIDVYFLHGLKALLAHNFRDFRTVATCLGADAVRNGLPSSRGKKEVLILGTADDPQTMQASRTGHEVWSKDLLVMGALRGVIQRSDEFIVARPLKEENDE